MHYIEVRPWKQRRGPPRFVPLGGEAGQTGFRSVYAYSPEVKAAIETQGSTADLGWAPVYSDCLFVDFDGADPGPFLVWLYDEGYGFELWDSGSKGHHVHVQLEPMEGSSVPHSQKKWVAANVPLADTTFYHQAGQFRLPRTVHDKTGKRKELLAKRGGKRLEIPLVEKPAAYGDKSLCGLGGEVALAGQLIRSKGQGERSVYVWHLAQCARREGLEFGVALSKILWWNSHYSHPPLPGETVTEKVREVYASSSRSA